MTDIRQRDSQFNKAHESTAQSLASPFWKKHAKKIICLLIIAVGVAGARYIQKTKPRAHKKSPVKSLPLVTTKTVYPTTQQIHVRAMGTVIPARETLLKSRVSGEVVFVHPEFVEGGLMKKGTVILLIDPEDYKLTVVQKQSAVIAAEYALKIEMGHQDVAKREWALIKTTQTVNTQNTDLALRKPHLKKAEADLSAAQAELEKARLNLSRTEIRSPFNAMIRKKMVEIGSQVTAQGQLAEIIGIDEYQIQVSLPVEKLKWIAIPKHPTEQGSLVRIVYRDRYEHTGNVTKLLGDLETQGRMARIVVSVKDPLGLSSPDEANPPLLIGEYVRVEIMGQTIENLFEIQNSVLHDNMNVWILGEDNKLEIRNVEIISRTAQTVLLKKGLNPGDRLITSDLAVPVPGMELKVL